MRISTLSSFPLLLAAGCGIDNGLNAKQDPDANQPVIDVSPESLSFADVEMGASATQLFTVTSVGTIDLDVTDIRLETQTAFSWASLDGKLPGALPVGESADVTITYVRESEVDFDTAWVDSNDAGNPSVSVLLYGGDVSPALELQPSSWDAGAIAAGDVVTGSINMVSTGGSPVVINDLSIVGDAEFTITSNDPLPITLAPGEESTVELAFSPSDIGTFSADLKVDADSPIGTLTAPLNGEGAGGPIAVCSAIPSSVDAITGTTVFTGDASYDTGGRSLVSYIWTLISVPSGSVATLARGSGANRDFTPDLAGTYTAQLVVTNDLGDSSEPCEASVDSVPTQDFWIEMYWTHSGDDMDLHLLRPAGTKETNGDCYYANCTGRGLEWGDTTVATDNPSLDLDDISATGPENINIDTPSAGDFTVGVHDYPGSVYNGVNDTTVNIYVGGALVWTDTRNINSEGYYEWFATVTWPGGIVTAL
ncbi:MAG: choice-of-anchor D domain-containing protein [Myxococcales bacterium]|nr:choice-of-anchor D domain-containing protein [Myxococcales bacterium]